MSSTTLSRRVMMAGAVTASALVLPVAADPSLAPNIGETSFPNLVARFIPLRERLADYTACWDAWAKACDEALLSATGVTMKEWRAMRVNMQAGDPLDVAYRKIEREILFDDPVDEHGVNIELNEIIDELGPVVKAMIARTPRSLADLAWQAEALMAWDSEFEEESDCPMERLHNHLIRNIQILAGAPAVSQTVQS